MHSPRLSHRSGGRNSQEFVRAHSHGSSLNGWRDAGDANAPLLQDAGTSDTTGRAEWVVEDSEEEAPLTFFGEVKRCACAAVFTQRVPASASNGLICALVLRDLL